MIDQDLINKINHCIYRNKDGLAPCKYSTDDIQSLMNICDDLVEQNTKLKIRLESINSIANEAMGINAGKCERKSSPLNHENKGALHGKK